MPITLASFLMWVGAFNVALASGKISYDVFSGIVNYFSSPKETPAEALLSKLTPKQLARVMEILAEEAAEQEVESASPRPRREPAAVGRTA